MTRSRMRNVRTGETARLDFVLEVGPVSAAIVVTADAPPIRADARSAGDPRVVQTAVKLLF